MYKMDRKGLLEFHVQVVNEARDLMVKKNSDYADESSVFGNLDLIESLFCGSNRTTEEGIVIRLGDKLARLAKSTQRELKVSDESVRDTVKDMINYAVLFLAKVHERKLNRTMAEEYGSELLWANPGEKPRTVEQHIADGTWDDESPNPATEITGEFIWKDHPANLDRSPIVLPHRVYMSGVYSNGGVLDEQERADNINIAVAAAKDVIKKGHYCVHIPHSATAPLDGVLTYEQHMTHDLMMIQLWATAVYRIPGESKGADREVERALQLGMPVWYGIDDVPEVVKCEPVSINASGT